MWDKNKIVITAIKDPFDPHGSRLIRTLDCDNQRTAFDYMKEIYPLIPNDIEVASSVNGKPLGKNIHSYIPAPGDNLVFCLVPEGGDTGRTIAMIIVMAIAIYTGQWWMNAYGGPGVVAGTYSAAGAATMAAGITAGVAFAGSMLVNALLPVQVPDTQAFGDPSSESTTYGWAPSANPIEAGRPWGVLYGTMRIFPQLLGRYIGTDNHWNKQYLNMLFGLTDHPLDSVTLTEFNENTESQYTDIEINKRLGAYDQPPIKYFKDTFSEVNISQPLEYDSWRSATAQGTGTQGLVVGIFFPQGLNYMTNSGEVTDASVNIDVQYRPLEDPPGGDWISMIPPDSPDAWSSDPGTYEPGDVVFHGGFKYRCTGSHDAEDLDFEPSTGSHSDAPWQRFQFPEDGLITASTRQAIRKAYRIDGILPDEYEIRAKLTVDPPDSVRDSNDVYLSYIQSIVYDDFTYPGATIVGVQALATDQLSGGMPRTSFLVTRNTVDVYEPGTGWVTENSNNPAWAAYDMHVNEKYGAAIPYARMNYQEFSDWADFCDDNGYEVNIYFDSFQSFPKAVNNVSIMGRATVIQRGTTFGVVIDRPADAVQMFGMGNIVANSYKEVFLDKKDRANCIEVTYFDAAKDYTRETIELRSVGFDTDTDITENKVQITLYGCTSKALAIKHAKFLLNCNQYLMRTISFEVGVDALASEVGDVILVSHDVPQWGYSGHVVVPTDRGVTLDRYVTLDTGTSYQVIVRHYDDDDIETANVIFEAPLWSSGTGYLLGESLEYDGNNYTALLAHTSGISSEPDVGGEWETYWVLDNTQIHIKTLTLDGLWLQTPQAGDVISFGEIDLVVKEFRVVNITRTQELTRKITALEYHSEIYTDAATVPAYESESDLPLVKNFDAQEIWLVENGIGVAIVNLSWEGFGVHTIYQKEGSDGTWQVLDIVSHAGSNDYNVRGVEPGKQYYFAVSPSSSPYDSETDDVTVAGHPPTPEDPAGVVASWEEGGFALTWTRNEFPWTLGYDVAIDGNIKTYGFGGTEYLFAELLATGTYDFKVRTRDAFGQTSDWVADSIDVDAYSAPATFTSSISKNNLINLTWEMAVGGTCPIKEYEIRKGAVFSAAEVVGTKKGNFTTVVELAAGSYTYWVVAIDIAGNYGTEKSVAVTITAYNAPATAAYSIQDNLVVLTWAKATGGSYPIDYYELRKGAVFSSADVVGTTDTTYTSIVELTVGSYTYWVVTVDVAGNYGTEISIGVNVVGYSAPGTFTSQVIDNNVLFTWTEAVGGTYPLRDYELRRGDVFSTADVIGNKKGTFTIAFETTSGTYRYWIAPVDIGGNYGTEKSLTVTVAQPPDFILNVLWEEDFIDGEPDSTNVFVRADGTAIAPCLPDETWQDHFSDNGWTNIQDAIDAGYTYMPEPVPLTAEYYEAFDYGDVLGSSLITVNLDKTDFNSGITVVTKIAAKELIGDSYVDQTGAQLFAANFQYVRDKFEITAASDEDFALLSQHSLRLDSKKRRDAGTGVTDGTGSVTISFGLDFIDVISIQVTAKGTTFAHVLYDFVDAPHPTDFDVYSFNEEGVALADIPFSWAVEGYSLGAMV